MKTLIVMRHGKAMPLEQGQRDMDRSLTRAGMQALEARLPHMLRLLETEGNTVHIWASPAKRAQQTAEILAKALEKNHIPLKKKIESHDCLWEQDIDKFLAELYACEDELVFAVGHIPFAEDVVDMLTGSTPSFSTGALGCLQVHFADTDESYALPAEDCARLLWFAQGPVAAKWETLNQLQSVIIEVAQAIEGHREAFFATKDEETIHRFRTYTRRLRSLMAFIRPWQNAKQNAKAQYALREIFGYTSRLRELDVLEKQARSNPDSSPKLLSECNKEANAERAKVLKLLSSKKITKSFEAIMAEAKSIKWKKRYIKRGLSKHEVRARFDEVIQSFATGLANIDLSDAEKTHDVRKRAKRARYVAEYAERILGASSTEIAEGLTAHQDRLGAICDARVNIRLINELLQQDLPRPVAWELALMRAQNETYLYSILKTGEV